MGTVTVFCMPRKVHMLVLLMAASIHGTWSCKSCMTSLLFFWKRSQPLRAIPLLEGSQGRVRSAQAKELWSVMLLPVHALLNGLITTEECFLRNNGCCSNCSGELVCTGTCCAHTLIPRLTVCECSNYCVQEITCQMGYHTEQAQLCSGQNLTAVCR